jgi:hypothetical protein
MYTISWSKEHLVKGTLGQRNTWSKEHLVKGTDQDTDTQKSKKKRGVFEVVKMDFK